MPASSLRHQLATEGHEVSARLRYEDCVFKAWNSESARYHELSDIRSRGDSDAAADCLLEQVRAVVENPDAQLIASIAGGRKTMGALLYACMALVGRETDRLTHVLVNEPFETGVTPKFYFPKQPCQQLTARDGQIVDVSAACIDLADVPFVPLRNLFERELVKRPSSFTGLVDRCRQHVAELARREIHLTVWRSRPEIQVNAAKVKFSSLQHVLMLFLAEAAAASKAPLGKYIEAIDPLQKLGEKLFANRRKDDFSDWRATARLPKDFDDQRLRKLRDELIDKLQAAGPDAAVLIPLLPKKGRFSLDVPASGISLRD